MTPSTSTTQALPEAETTQLPIFLFFWRPLFQQNVMHPNTHPQTNKIHVLERLSRLVAVVVVVVSTSSYTES